MGHSAPPANGDGTATAVRSYRQFAGRRPLAGRLREALRDAAVRALSLGRSPGRGGGWLRFPFYHHVFDDERVGFARQLDYMARHGEFIGLDDALGLLDSATPIDGRYFCLTFDDGLKNCATNGAPILLDKGAPAAIFLATHYIGTDIEADRDLLLGFYDDGRTLIEFLDWDDCRRLAEAGMTFGSHTENHVHLSELDAAGVKHELARSKRTIEDRLGRECRHFCCPFGRPGINFWPERDPEIARRLGYRSFLTTRRGANRTGDSPMAVRRDHLLAGWGDYQLRYFLAG